MRVLLTVQQLGAILGTDLAGYLVEIFRYGSHSCGHLQRKIH